MLSSISILNKPIKYFLKFLKIYKFFKVLKISLLYIYSLEFYQKYFGAVK